MTLLAAQPPHTHSPTTQQLTATHAFPSWNRIADSGAAEVGTVLGPAQRIDDLNLSHNLIADAGCATLCKAMLTNLTLTVVDLSFNRIGSDGAASLGRMLRHNQRLISVDLANNSIGKAQRSGLRTCCAIVCTRCYTWQLTPSSRHTHTPATTFHHWQATLASHRLQPCSAPTGPSRH